MKVFHPSDFAWFAIVPLLIICPIKYKSNKAELVNAKIKSVELEIKLLEKLKYIIEYDRLGILSEENYKNLLLKAASFSHSRFEEFIHNEFLMQNLETNEPTKAGWLVFFRIKDICADYKVSQDKVASLTQSKAIYGILSILSFLAAPGLLLFRIGWINAMFDYLNKENHELAEPEATLPTKEIKYFLWVNDSQDGPYTFEELTQKLESGEINDTSLCYPWDGSWDGMNQDDNWIQLKDLPNWTGFNPPSEE